ncbi:MAG TPA: hypothetical protein VFV95_02585 [Vicinamibacterales bacterium]|nr:hypothetical protein [Vicinamibacterales bacterium]
MPRPALLTMLIAVLSVTTIAQNRRGVSWNETDAAAIRALLADGFETSWNNHQPAASATPDKCESGAVFINVTGGWLKGCEAWQRLITPLHAPGGQFYDHTRRHAIEDLQFVRSDVAIAVVRTLDIRRAGVPTAGEETRGLVVVSKRDGRWRLNANQNGRILETPAGNR